MRGLGSYAFMQSRWPIRAFGLCRGKMQQALGSLAYCLPHSALKFPPPPSPSHATRSLRLLVGAFPAACRRASCLPIQLLAVFRLLACLPPPPPPPAYLMAAYLVFPAACRAVRLLAGPLRLLAFLLGCLPSLEAAFPLCGLLALPGSSGASRSPLAHCLCLLVSLSCVVRRRVFFRCFFCCQLLPHPHVGLALRLVRMNLFLGRHPLLSEDFAFFLCRSWAPPCQVGQYVHIILLLYPGKVHPRFGQIMSIVCSFPPLWVWR